MHHRNDLQGIVMPRTAFTAHVVGAMLLLVTTVARAQSGGAADRAIHPVAGSVVDEGGAPVAFADIRLLAFDGSRQSSQTDRVGHFLFLAVPDGMAEVEIRRLGFRPFTGRLNVPFLYRGDSTRIVLATLPAELRGIEVSGERDGSLAGFYSRQKSNNFGHYLDRAAIEATHAQRPSESLRGVPGVRLLPSPRVGNMVRIRNCRPTIWLDGIRVQEAELDEVSSMDDVAAIEVYKSLAGLPPQFIDRTNPCGGILIWSRNH
jgi:hypothetical protein